MSQNEEIRAALLTWLRTISGLPKEDQWTEENTPFDPTIGTPWLASQLLFDGSELLTMPARNAWKQRDGAWRLLLHYPIDTGTATADAVSQAIEDAFPVGLTLDEGSTTVRIRGVRRSAGGPDITTGWYAVPVEIRWYVVSTNTL